MRISQSSAAAAVLGLLAGCAPAQMPGMVAVPRTDAAGEMRAPDATQTVLVVAFPRSPCAGSDGLVFVDDAGAFVGAVAPGTAASLRVPPATKHLFAVSSGEIDASPRSPFVRHEIPRRSDQGVVVAVPRADGHNCSSPPYRALLPAPEATDLASVWRATAGLTWLEPRAVDGNRWLAAHRARVDEIAGLTESRVAPEAVTSTLVLTQAR